MKFSRFSKIAVACVAAFSLGMASSAMAEWPQGDVTYITNFNPGGESDMTARMQESTFRKVTGHGFIYQYRVGAGGAAGWAQLNRITSDGSAMMGINTPHIFLQPLAGNVGYKTEDVNVVYIFQLTPYALIVPADSPIKDLDDYIARAKASPGTITVAGTGTNSAPHVAKESFDHHADIKTTYIPFTGTAAASAALLGRQVQAQWAFTTVGVEQGERVRLLGVAMEERHPLFPDVPTFKEKGIDFTGGARRGVAVPNGVSEAMRQEMSDVFAKVNQDPDLRKRMEDAGYVLLDIPYSQMAEYTRKLSEDYQQVARLLGMIQ
ncbi:MAG: Bug family tripartite tricarboxylate transporter substrate binding protein [Thioalkalivibrio sp.]